MQRDPRTRTLELALPPPAATPWCGPWLVAGVAVIVAIALLLGP